MISTAPTQMLPIPSIAPAAVSRDGLKLNPRDTATDPLVDRIRRLSRAGRPRDALALFRDLATAHPSDLPISSVLACCAALRAVRSGREVHGFMVRNPGTDTCHSRSSLIVFYAKLGFLALARKLFDGMPERDVVAWTAMIMSYVSLSGLEGEAMGLFTEMLCSGVLPNPHSITVVLRGALMETGEQVHGFVVKNGWDSDVFVGSSLIDFYGRNGILVAAELVFDGIEHKDAVCCNSLISNYGRSGRADGIVSVFMQMGLLGLVPNQSTLVGLLNGSANLGFMGLSKQFHSQAVVRGFDTDEVVQGVVVDMYAKCGDLEQSLVAFDRMGFKKSVVAWNSMIGGYGKHGRTKEALQMFDAMELAGVQPDYITFTCLLSACSHSGFVDEGWRLFNLMVEGYGIPARNEHYCCMVDLMGRRGMVCEAYKLIKRNGCQLEPSVWGALLSACRVWGFSEIGEVAAKKLFETEPHSSGAYVALAAIFASSGRWNDATTVREWMDNNGIKKDPGCSWIEVDGVIHTFKAGEGVEDLGGMMEVYCVCNLLNFSIRNHPALKELVGFVEIST